MNEKTELLAPAGSYEGFLGAIHAGADAVYLGGSKFGARAYADNFSDEEICLAIRYAHLRNRKVYLTLNTLLKNTELTELYAYLEPFVAAGLDAVIIQDIGVFSFVREQFPTLPLHVSTQMAITGPFGAKFLKDLGASRIVPARELSLLEIQAMKADVSIELETFIHGAMCYSYSGNCLFSSMLGERSGNRGRCAQPCRLPYSLAKGKKETYPLSLKDMCTLPLLPKLIDAKIDSFKIEGRMKRPEYTAGVTAIYRKYIDLYTKNPKASFHVLKEDMELLQNLYIRSEIQSGYYEKQNGKEMISLFSPTYEKTEETLLNKIRADYIETKQSLPLQGTICLQTGKQAMLSLWGEEKTETLGDTVLEAIKQPLTKEAVEKQLKKTGNSFFELKNLTIQMDETAFLPVKALNELRRTALEEMTEKLLLQKCVSSNREFDQPSFWNEIKPFVATTKDFSKKGQIQVSVLTKEQFYMLSKLSNVDRIYIDILILFDSMLDTGFQKAVEAALTTKEIILTLPHIWRKKDAADFPKLEALIKDFPHTGIMVRNLEQIGWLSTKKYRQKVVADNFLYCFNQRSKDFWQNMGVETTLSYEMNEKELKRFSIQGMNLCVYGRIPMMVSANCVSKTLDTCKNQSSFWTTLYDRYQTIFPVRCICHNCYNVIYNSVPLFLKDKGELLRVKEGCHIRYDFTTETPVEAKEILMGLKVPTQYTKGHFARGVE